jgi:hypothetical protein
MTFWQIVPERACAWLDPRAGRRPGGGGPRLGPHLLLPQVRGPGGGRSGTLPYSHNLQTNSIIFSSVIWLSWIGIRIENADPVPGALKLKFTNKPGSCACLSKGF